MRQVKVTVELTVSFDEKRVLLSEVKEDLAEHVRRFSPQEAEPFRNVTGGSWWTDRAMVTMVADDTIRVRSASPYPTHRYAGTSKERQEIGLPGHCEGCAEHGHVKAHPSLGCGDVGCTLAHGPDEG